jgi:hypothetical protein
MIWIARIFVALVAIANDIAWLATDPVAIVALAKSNCTLPTLDCLRQAKSFHAQLVQEHTDAYWFRVNEESARVEHEKQAKDAPDLYVAQQMAKGDKWDKWEVSPPTIIHNEIHQTINHGIINHNTLINPTFVSTCTPPPKIPQLDAKDLTAKYRPSMEDKLTIGEYDVEESVLLTFCKNLLAIVIVVCLVICGYLVVSKLIRELRRASGWVVGKLFAPRPRPPPPPPSPQSQTPRTPQQQVTPYIPSTKKQGKTHAHFTSPARSSARSRQKKWPPGAAKYSSAIGQCSHREGSKQR